MTPWGNGGFCSIRSLPSACRRRVALLMVQFPPFDGDATGRQVTHGSPRAARNAGGKRSRSDNPEDRVPARGEERRRQALPQR